MNKHLPPSSIRRGTRHSYFVVMINYGRRGYEAIVDPEKTRSNIIDLIRSGEYCPERILFIHEVNDFGGGDMTVENVTDDLVTEAGGVLEGAEA